MKLIRVVCAVVVQNGCVLMTKRPAHVDLPNLWEFPGGKIHDGENAENAMKREMREELDVDVEVLRLLQTVHHQYTPDRRHELMFYECRVKSGRLSPRVSGEMAWVALKDLAKLEVPEGDREFIVGLPKLLQEMKS